jgi:SAM-dependent methyltransferase
MNQHNTHAPSPWISRHAHLIPTAGRVLDLACGAGRNGRLFLEAGHPTVFLDIDTSAVADLADTENAEILQFDLEDKSDPTTPYTWPFGQCEFSAVVVTNYLWRPLLPTLVDSVAPNGVLLYETFAEGNEAFGRPRNPDFLLKAGELLEVVRNRLRVIAYGQEIRDTPNPAVIQHIAAIRD